MPRTFHWLKKISALALAIAILLPFYFASTNERVVATNTLLFGLLTTIIAIPLAVWAATICLNTGPIPRLLWGAVLGLAVTPIFMHVSAWDSAFGKLGWVVNSGGTGNDVTRWACAVWIHAAAAIPQVTLIIWLALFRSGRSFEEQALLDAGRIPVFLRITLPRLAPVLLFSAIWIFVVCSREIAVTDIYRIGTIAEQIYLGYSLGDFSSTDGQQGLASGSPFSLTVWAAIVGMAVLLTSVLLRSLPQFTMADEVIQPTVRRASALQSFAGFVLLAALLLVPLGNLVIRSSKQAEMIEGKPVVSYSLAHLASIVSNVPTKFAEEFFWSAGIAGISGMVGMAIALITLWLAKEVPNLRWLPVISFALCAALPGPLVGSMVLQAREWIDQAWYRSIFDRTILPPLLANIVFCWPLSCVLAWIVIDNVPADVLESARLDGASAWSRLTRFVVRGNQSMVIGFAMLLFAFCFGELSASQLAIPPGMDTIPRRMLGLLHAGVNDLTAGLTLVLFGLIGFIFSIGYGLSIWQVRKSGQ